MDSGFQTSPYRVHASRMLLVAVQGAVVGALAFLACMDVAFGLGAFSIHAFDTAAIFGLLGGALLGLLRVLMRSRRLAYVLACGYGAALTLGLTAVVVLSRAEGVAGDTAGAVLFICSDVAFGLAAGLLTGMILLRMRLWTAADGTPSAAVPAGPQT